ncbi:MAG: hypothetical protein M1281_13230 [Chloroflexi bacterium]|nr:hypothetical protein [Chloroflexota bacterium]
MESLKRGFTFFKQAWQMARADPDLIKPSIYALITVVLVTIVGAGLIILPATLLSDHPAGPLLAGFFGILLIFSQLAVGYIFSAMTVHLVFSYLGEGDGCMDRAWAIVRRDWLDLLSLAAVSTVVSLIKRLLQGKRSSGVRSQIGGIVGALWNEATYLILPAMVIENLGLKDGLLRTAQIVRDNLLLMGVSMIGVRLVNGLIGLVLGAAGIALGIGAGMGIAAITQGAPLGTVAALAAGILVAGLLIAVAIVLASYNATAYHTCLYLWAREVERSRQPDHPGAAEPPAPLAAAMEGIASISSPVYTRS